MKLESRQDLKVTLYNPSFVLKIRIVMVKKSLLYFFLEINSNIDIIMEFNGFIKLKKLFIE